MPWSGFAVFKAGRGGEINWKVEITALLVAAAALLCLAGAALASDSDLGTAKLLPRTPTIDNRVEENAPAPVIKFEPDVAQEQPTGGAHQKAETAGKTAATKATPAKTTVLQGHLVQPASVPEPKSGLSGIFDVVASLKPADLTKRKSSSTVKKVVSKGQSLANFTLNLRGFDFSKEGANVALDEHLKPDSSSAREYLTRIDLDNRELSLISGIIRLADTMSCPSSELGTKRSDALATIQHAVGAEKATNIYSRLHDLQPDDYLPVHWSLSWDMSDRDKKCKQIFEAAAEKDPVVQQLQANLHKYNNRSKFLQISAKVVYSTMGVASFAPTFIAPIADTTMAAFMMATGGPEQDKLLKEMYLCKSLESRYRLIAQKTNLVAESYSRAMMTHNMALWGSTRELLKDMTSERVVADVFAAPPAGLCHDGESNELIQRIAMPNTPTE